MIDIHRMALSGQAPNLTLAREKVSARFDVALGTAIEWLDLLEELGFLVRLPGVKRSETRIVPSQEAKAGLYKVGQDYLICLGQVVRQLRHAIQQTETEPDSLEWLAEIKRALESDVTDYPTRLAKSVKRGDS